MLIETQKSSPLSNNFRSLDLVFNNERVISLVEEVLSIPDEIRLSEKRYEEIINGDISGFDRDLSWGDICQLVIKNLRPNVDLERLNDYQKAGGMYFIDVVLYAEPSDYGVCRK